MNFFNNLGSVLLFDQRISIDLSILEAQNEFLNRREEYLKNPNNKYINIIKIAYINSKKILPLLCSECPGWICYAEKVIGDDIIPNISKVRSPQQIMGNIVKNVLPELLGLVINFLIN